MYGCSNCFRGFAKPQRLDSSGNLAKLSKDSRGADQGEGAPLNKALETSSSNDMENNGNNTRQQRTSSSISANNHIQETPSTSDSNTSNPFVNHALNLWTERRREWVGTRERPRPVQHREPVISWSTTYEDLLATSRPFPQPIPLPEMVDFLVDVWEQEGLYE